MKARAICFISSLACFGISPVRAALQEDLGQGLAYVRAVDLNTDLPAVEKALTNHAVVLDFRNTTATNERTAQLAADLDKVPDPHAVRLVLLSSTTFPGIMEVVSAGRPGIVTLAARSVAVTPDILLSVSSEDDRHAYDAFTGGTPLDKLLTNTLEKKRFDEAALVHDRATANNPSDAEPDDDAGLLSPEAKEGASTPAAATPPKKPVPAPLIDVVLQRAVQLHRAMLALKKV